MSIPLICIALLAFLGIGLGMAVSSTRAKTETLSGSSTDPENFLYKMVRAHGNTMEYAPMLALLIYVLSQYTQSTWVLWCMVVVTISRYLFVVGIFSSQSLATANPLRFIGALGTYLAGFGLCIALLLTALKA